MTLPIRIPRLMWFLFFVSSLVQTGCRDQKVTQEDTGPVTVTVSRPVQRQVTEYGYFIGRTEAVNSVEIKARVTGYLEKTLFQEGGEVRAGEVLCQIDPRTYQAQLDSAQGELSANEAKYRLAKTENDRAKSLYKENSKAISLKALDQHQAEEEAAAAAVIASKAALQVYQLNVEFTKIASPIDGRVGRYQVTEGNLVSENVSTLTTVVSQDPIYVYFNIDEPTMLGALRKLFSGELPPLNSKKIHIGVELQDEQGYPHQGTVDFADNVVDPSTGTITVRAAIANPANSSGLRLLLPGLFVRIRLPLGRPEEALLIAQQAVGTDQGQKYVYVVDATGTVEYRRVTLGQLQEDGLRVVKEGLAADDQVIVNGLQIVQPKAKVKSDEIAMPTISQQVSQTDSRDKSLPNTAGDE